MGRALSGVLLSYGLVSIPAHPTWMCVAMWAPPDPKEAVAACVSPDLGSGCPSGLDPAASVPSQGPRPPFLLCTHGPDGRPLPERRHTSHEKPHASSLLPWAARPEPPLPGEAEGGPVGEWLLASLPGDS